MRKYVMQKITKERIYDLIFETFDTFFEAEKAFRFGHCTIKYWFTRNTMPNLKHLVDLSNFYNVSISYLMGLTNQHNKNKEYRISNDINDIHNNVKEFFKYWSDELGTIKNVAEKFNINSMVIHQIINDRNKTITPITLYDIYKATNIYPEEILSGEFINKMKGVIEYV